MTDESRDRAHPIDEGRQGVRAPLSNEKASRIFKREPAVYWSPEHPHTDAENQ